MQKKSKNMMMALFFMGSAIMGTAADAAKPLWTFEALTPTTVAVPENGMATVQYRVTNQSNKQHSLTMKTFPGITQITSGLGVCGSRFVLKKNDSCILSIAINGSKLENSIMNGPVVCQCGSPNQCYQPSAKDVLQITKTPPITDVVITVTGSPLTLTASGYTGQLTVTNTSTETAATNISSNFTGTALDGKVTETGNTCANVSPGASCTLTYTPGNTTVPETNFIIQGTNSNALTAAITIQPASTLTNVNPASGTASGGTGVVLTGTGLSGVTSVTFDGVAATSVNVVNSTTVTAVTPAHATGAVDVVVSSAGGSATLSNGYTYNVTAIGQPTGGGVIACLNGGLNNLIAATSDISSSIQWGGIGTAIGPTAQSETDGASNTAAIVAELTGNQGIPITTYAAGLCSNYEVDSQGNTPCQAGNTCYNDWFLPAGFGFVPANQIYCLYVNRVAIGGFDAGGFAYYWSSTERNDLTPQNTARMFDFTAGNPSIASKDSGLFVRCVRAFTP